MLRAAIILALWLPATAFCGAQKYEPLSASVQAALSGRIADQAPPRSSFTNPLEAADWLTDRAGLRTTRKQVSNWLARGRLSKARRIGRGVWEFNQAELVDTRLAQEGESA